MIENGAIAIKGDTIVAVGPSDEVMKTYTSERLLDGTNKLVMPGLIDAHIHTGISIFRGDCTGYVQLDA